MVLDGLSFGVLTRDGESSPLGKFDEFLGITTGTSGESFFWEEENRTGMRGGHCNGWAAASILYPEPDSGFTNPLSNQELKMSDRKALLTASSFCVHWAFYGHRMYLSSPEEERSDIDPVLFHKVVLYYVNRLKKPVALDYYSSHLVDNNVITGYEFTVATVDDEENAFDVSMKLKTHYYTYAGDGGPAPFRNRTYSYRLYVNSDGMPVDGRWHSNNPDFLWVPLAPKDCGRQNPHLKKASVEIFVYGREISSTPNLPNPPGDDPGQDPGQNPNQIPGLEELI